MLIFQKILIQKWKSKLRLIEEFGPELYFKNLTQATFSPEINKEIWEIMQEKGSELENHSALSSDSSRIACDFSRPSRAG